MKRLLFILFFIPLLTIGQNNPRRISVLPEKVAPYSTNDFTVIANSGENYKVSLTQLKNWIALAGFDTTNIYTTLNAKVDTIYKNSTRDSIIFTIGGRRRAIKDSIGGGSSIDTTSLSNRINLKVDTIYKNATRDSIVYKINNRRHAVKDSTGTTVVYFDNLGDFQGFYISADWNDYPIGTIFYCNTSSGGLTYIDPTSSSIDWICTRLETAGTAPVIYDAYGTTSGKVHKAYIPDIVGAYAYNLTESQLTLDQAQNVSFASVLPFFNNGDIVRIDGSDSPLPNNVVYVYLPVVNDSTGGKKLGRACTMLVDNKVTGRREMVHGYYDLASNKAIWDNMPISINDLGFVRYLPVLGQHLFIVDNTFAGSTAFPSIAGGAYEVIGVSLQIGADKFGNLSLLYDGTAQIGVNNKVFEFPCRYDYDANVIDIKVKLTYAVTFNAPDLVLTLVDGNAQFMNTPTVSTVTDGQYTITLDFTPDEVYPLMHFSNGIDPSYSWQITNTAADELTIEGYYSGILDYSLFQIPNQYLTLILKL